MCITCGPHSQFQNKISVVGKDGSHTSVAEPSVKTRPAPDYRENIGTQPTPNPPHVHARMWL